MSHTKCHFLTMKFILEGKGRGVESTLFQIFHIPTIVAFVPEQSVATTKPKNRSCMLQTNLIKNKAFSSPVANANIVLLMSKKWGYRHSLINPLILLLFLIVIKHSFCECLLESYTHSTVKETH